MQVKQLLLALLLCGSVLSYGQKPYYNQQENYLKANSVWVFGRHAGLDFNSGSLVAFTSGIETPEGCASVADQATGQLLFYSDGKKCWNRNNQVMPNGDSLMGNRGSTCQGVCIVPMIDSPGKYYLFSLYGSTDWLAQGYPPASGTLFYSIVDMRLDNDLGDIVSTQKNIRLSKDTLSELMIAIPGDNCDDIWLLIHDFQNPVFKAYHITSKGLDTIPTISISGKQIQGRYAYLLGHLRVSPDRSMVALTSGYSVPQPPYTGTLLAKFDAVTGKVSDAIKLANDNSFDICFSPDSKKLYMTSSTSSRVKDSRIIQWNISNYDSASIASSMKIIDSIHTAYLSIKLYDNKIYSSYAFDNSTYTFDSLVGIIHYPNLSGQACDFEPSFASLYPNHNWFNSFSNDVVFPLSLDTAYHRILDTAFCGNDQPVLTLEGTSGYSGYYWDDGSTGQKRVVSKTGTYWVLNEDACHSRVDTFVVKIFNLIPPVIAVDSFTLKTASSYTTYQWMFNGNLISGATQSTYTVTQNGKYQVIVSNEPGCTDTSDVYLVTNYTGITAVHLLANRIWVYPNPATDMVYIQSPVKVNVQITDIAGKTIKKQADATSVPIDELAKGIYLLHLTNENGVLLKVEKLVKSK